MAKISLLIAGISGIIAVSLGAFGAHALKAKLDSLGYLATFQTGVHYQFYHTLALAIIGLLLAKFPNPWLTYSSYFFMIGILLFSGSLYMLSLSGIKWIGAITPIGGLAFILGWASFIVAILKIKF